MVRKPQFCVICAADPSVAHHLFCFYLFLHRHLKATVAEGDAAAVRLTQEVQPPCCRSEVHSSVLFAALAVAAAASGEAEIPRMVLEWEVIQNKAGVLLYEEPEFIYIGGDLKKRKKDELVPTYRKQKCICSSIHQ